jgi:hypothetical protein
MSQESKYNWAVAQRIDTNKRTVVVEMGIIDSFGGFHPEPEMIQHMTNPDWLNMPEEEFLKQARLHVEQNRQSYVEHAG